MSQKVFLSYASEDKEWAMQVLKHLRKKGVPGLDVPKNLDTPRFETGQDVRQRIRKEIESAKNILFIWTPNAAASDWVRYELGMADALGKQIFVVADKTAPDLPSNLSKSPQVLLGPPSRVRKKSADEITCFVIMPFDDEFNAIYSKIIKPTVERFDIVCRRKDEYPSVGGLSTGIVSYIANASFIIADVTSNNPNVYYELGIADSLEKTVILLSQSSPPADIRYWKYIVYKNVVSESMRISENLKQAIKEAIEAGKIRKAQASSNR
jgi:hypothetical protein